MMLAIFLAVLAIGDGTSVNDQAADLGTDELAFTCLADGPALFVAAAAVGRESPNENAMRLTARIADTCRSARVRLEPSNHVCLETVSAGERLADRLSQVYAGRMSVTDFRAFLQAEDAPGNEDDRRLEADEQCQARMSELIPKTVTGQNQ